MSHTSIFTSDLSGFNLVTTLHSLVTYKAGRRDCRNGRLVTTLHFHITYKAFKTMLGSADL